MGGIAGDGGPCGGGACGACGAVLMKAGGGWTGCMSGTLILSTALGVSSSRPAKIEQACT